MTFPFDIQVIDYSGTHSEDAKITVFDGWDEIKGEAEDTIHLDLPRGLYTIRVQRAGRTWEQVFRHTGPTAETLFSPQ